MKTRRSIIITLLMLTSATQFAGATVRIVTNTADSGAGSLRDTIAASAAGDAIHFSGMLLGTVHIVLTTGELAIGKDLTIEGLGRRILIDGNANSTVFHITLGTVNISGLTITNGSSTTAAGGGLRNESILTVSNCTFSGNFATHDGGGIENYGGSLIVKNCHFYDNVAGIYGGGIDSSGSLIVNNSTFSGNGAQVGGGISAKFSAITVNHCTFCGNQAFGSGSGGGIEYQTPIGTNTATLQNTIIAGNNAGNNLDVEGIFTSQGFNLIGQTNGSSGWIASDLIGSTASPRNAGLGPLQNNGGNTLSMAPLPGSPAIDSGTNNGFTTDQIGQPRPYDYASLPNASGGDGSDIGAYEVQGLAITDQPQSQFVAAGQNVTFTVGVTGPSTPGYQWYTDAGNISGANSASYTRNNVQLADAGNYSVLVGDAYGFTSSAAANLTVGFTLTRTINGNGSVVPNPDQAIYTNNALVTLAATPASGWLFGSWSGDVSGTNSSANIVMTANKAVVANFVPGYSLTLATNGNGVVIRSPDQTLYGSNSTVLLTASPSPGWLFGGWSGSASGTSNPLNVTMTTNKSITANFFQPTLNVIVTGGGIVVKNPDQLTYASDSTVNLAAYPASGWRFNSWSGDASGTANPLTVPMITNKVITANFTTISASACVPVSAAVVGWWPGAGNANDIVGTNNGTLLGGVTYLPGKVGQAFSFNGNDAAVYLQGGPALTFANECSVEAWIRPDDVGNYRQIFYQANDASAAYWALGLSTNGSFRLEVNAGSGLPIYDVVNSPPGLLSVGTWAHVAATFNGGALSLYLNGTNVAVRHHLVVSYLFALPPTAAYIGARVTSERFAGLIDELSVYNRELNFQQIYLRGSAGKCLTPAYLTSVSKSGNSVNLSWLAQKGMSYRIEYKTNLTDGAWISFSGNVTATNNTASRVDSTLGTAPQRFYRVALLP